MSNRIRLIFITLLAVALAGCANNNIKPAQVICPVVGALVGGGVVYGMGGHDEGALAGGAAVGAGIGYLFCREKAEPPAPAKAPAAPAPVAKPQPPKDSDGDGVIDPNDKCPGTPHGVKVNAEGCPEVGEKLMTLEGVNFDTDKATIKPESAAILDHAVQVLQENAGVSVRVEGNTDSRGSDAYNQRLSEKRAAAVMDYLVKHGVDAARLTSVGHGEANPVAPNDSAANMYKNRRVDLVVSK